MILNLIIHHREATFNQAPERDPEDYVDWPDPTKDHPTMFYPSLKLKRFPKRYQVFVLPLIL